MMMMMMMMIIIIIIIITVIIIIIGLTGLVDHDAQYYVKYSDRWVTSVPTIILSGNIS